MIEERVIIGVSPAEIVQEHIGRYKFALDYVKGKKVLDCACGSGYGSHMLTQSAYDVVGVDISPEAIEYAKEHYKAFNLEFIKADACNLPFDDSTFDVIVSFETFEHIRDYETFLKECKRVLREHGTLIISTPNKKVSPGTNHYHVFEMYPTEFCETLLKEFKLVDLHGQNDVDTSKQRLKKVYFWIKEKLGIKRALFPTKKSYPVSYFKDGIVKSDYMVAVCYG